MYKKKFPNTPKPSSPALERVDAVEKQLIGLVQQLQKVFNEQENKNLNFSVVINALVEIAGKERVRDVVDNQRREGLEAESKTISDLIAKEVESGNLTATDIISDETNIVVSTQKDASGKTLHPEKIQIPLRDYQPEVRELLKGKGVGGIVTLPDTTTVEVLAIYAVTPKNSNETQSDSK